MMRQIKLLCLLLALGFQNIHAQEHKHVSLTGKEITFDNPNDYTIVGVLGTFSNDLRSRILAMVLDGDANPCNIETNSNTND